MPLELFWDDRPSRRIALLADERKAIGALLGREHDRLRVRLAEVRRLLRKAGGRRRTALKAEETKLPGQMASAITLLQHVLGTKPGTFRDTETRELVKLGDWRERPKYTTTRKRKR